MGLDMYARTTREPIATPVDFDLPKGKTKDLHYWRKHPNLHGWMEALYRKKSGTDEQFNCVNLQLTMEDLDQLENDINGDHLPATSGFFFGTTTGDEKEDDLAFIRKARDAIEDGLNVYYKPWW